MSASRTTERLQPGIGSASVENLSVLFWNASDGPGRTSDGCAQDGPPAQRALPSVIAQGSRFGESLFDVAQATELLDHLLLLFLIEWLTLDRSCFQGLYSRLKGLNYSPVSARDIAILVGIRLEIV